MNKLQVQIHELFKSKYEAATGNKMITPKRRLPSRNRYVFEDLSKNLYEEMSDNVKAQFMNGGGEDIFEKMHSLRSSSAMTYNVFGNDKVSFKGTCGISEGSYEVNYENPLETYSGAKTKNHIDVLLKNDRELNFIEMKFFEPFYHKISFKREIPSAFEDRSKYIYTDSAFPFMESIRRIKRAGLVRYDACQMFTHALGIYNYVLKNELELKGKKIQLINCIWTLDNPFEEEKYRREF
ncbi:hypothetical protein, partial [Treponema sp.]|uniref:PGN_0703 family putative restriction endonuclease n=1 Tax=Treponema sp. TaxID=166 RepID=UPI0025EB9A79